MVWSSQTKKLVLLLRLSRIRYLSKFLPRSDHAMPKEAVKSLQ